MNAHINRQNVLEKLLISMGQRRDEFEALLPPDLSYDRFYATTHQALRQYPKLLDCEPKSLLNAIIKAAYDGLRIDGKEAVITVDEVTFDKGKPTQRTVKMARYMPMAYGMIQQVLRGGEVLSMTADVIYAADEYDVQLGTDPHILHRPLLTGERGPIIAAYSIATLKSGVKTFELVDKADLASIRACAQTTNVWDKWPGEQSKKSAIRRHRKRLPTGDRDIVIRDAEAEELYPQFVPPAVADQRPRPTRQSIADQSGTAAGVPLDLQEEDEAVVIEHTEKSKPARKSQKREAAAEKTEKPAAQADVGGIPEDEDAWRTWTSDLERRLSQAADKAGVDAIAVMEEPRIEAASPERARWARGLISDRLTDFVAGDN